MTAANRRVEVQARRQWQSSLEHAQNAHGTPAILAFRCTFGLEKKQSTEGLAHFSRILLRSAAPGAPSALELRPKSTKK